MTTVEDIEKAIAELPADQLARFRAWFEEFDAAQFDAKIERDAKAASSTSLLGRHGKISAPAVWIDFAWR
jgi:hypothetical protein